MDLWGGVKIIELKLARKFLLIPLPFPIHIPPPQELFRTPPTKHFFVFTQANIEVHLQMPPMKRIRGRSGTPKVSLGVGR